ncbi:MAG: DUF5357 domain-containing protein [Synechococcales cyanobacterium RM1_1_8]|nr:DUF5357 domain-containing protein [Synechococcales cyanobacterium RM1_1_8]
MKALLQSFWQSLWGALRPASAYSWQTALWMSLLAWLLAQLARSPEQVQSPISVHGILTSLSWMFLILAVGWLTLERPLKLLGINFGPWLTGALVCLFLFVRRDYSFPRTALVTWPLISAAIAAVPEFIDIESGFSIPRGLRVRQNIVLMLLVNLLLTSWITFSFRLNDWLLRYPGLRGEAFSQSFFLMPRDRDEEDFSRGITIVREMERQLGSNVSGQTQSQVERWLLDNQTDPLIFRDLVMNTLAAQRAETATGRPLPRPKDDRFWQLETLVSEPAYQVELRARWIGPRANEAGHLVKHTCKVDFGSNLRATVSCPNDMIVITDPKNDPIPVRRAPALDSLETSPTL